MADEVPVPRDYPDWWPKNPYPTEVFPMTSREYAEAIPDEAQRTAISGCLGRLFWNIASRSIFDAMKNADEEEDHADDE